MAELVSPRRSNPGFSDDSRTVSMTTSASELGGLNAQRRACWSKLNRYVSRFRPRLFAGGHLATSIFRVNAHIA
jgi:hypothetical protein